MTGALGAQPHRSGLNGRSHLAVWQAVTARRDVDSNFVLSAPKINLGTDQMGKGTPNPLRFSVGSGVQ